MLHRPPFTPLAVALLTLATPAVADEELYFASLPIVASVSRLQQPLAETPGSMTVIDRDLIRKSGARSVSELMRLIPGFFSTPANQDAPRVAYHGMSDESYSPRVQVLIDGISQYSPLFRGGVNWNLLPVALEDIERIEVMRGSNSTAYGANAFMGVIHIITTDPALSQGWMVKADQGYKSVRDYTLRWGGRIGDANVRLTVQEINDSGLRHMYTGSEGWFDPNDSRHAKVYDLRGTLALSARDELQFSLSQAYDVSGQGRPYDNTDIYRDAAKSSTALSVGWRRSLGNGDEMRLRLAHVEDWASDKYPVLYGGMNFLLSDSGRGSRTELEFQHNFAPSPTTRVVWGGGLRHEQVESTKQFFTNGLHSRFSARMFGNLEWRPMAALLFNAGANLESDNRGHTVFGPRLGASWHITKAQTLRFVASRNHRIPGLFETQGDSRYAPINNPNFYDRTFMAYQGKIDPEKLDTMEVGYLWDLKEYRASLDLRVFREHMPNKMQFTSLTLDSSTRDFFQADGSRLRYGWADSYFNAEDARISGLEYQFKWQPLDGTRILYNHSYIHIDTKVDPNHNYTYPGPDIETMTRFTQNSAPRHAGYLMWMQQLPYDLESTVSYYKTGYMKWTRNTYIAPIERVDWRLAWPFKIGASRGELAYVVQAANRTNGEFRSTRLFGQRNWLSLRLDFDQSAGRADPLDAPLDLGRDAARRDDGFADDVGIDRRTLGRAQHRQHRQHLVAVAAAGQIRGSDQFVAVLLPDRLAADFQADHPLPGDARRIVAHPHSGNLRHGAAAAGRQDTRETVFEHMPQLLAGHRQHHDGVFERHPRLHVAPGQRPRASDAVGAQPPAVDQRHIGAGRLSERIGDEIAEIAFAPAYRFAASV